MSITTPSVSDPRDTAVHVDDPGPRSAGDRRDEGDSAVPRGLGEAARAAGLDLASLTDMIWPYAVRAAATLRLADLVAPEGTRIEDLATAAGADADALDRLMRYLASRGMFREVSAGTFAPTDAALLLADRHPGRLRGWFDMDGLSGRTDRAVAGLLEAVRSGRPAYPTIFGRTYYEDMGADSDLRSSFDAFMAAYSTPAVSTVTGLDWSDVRHVVDVGGASGTILAELLRSHPHLHGTLVDLPEPVAVAAGVFEAAGVARRASTAPGSFFDPLPGGADVYLLSSVLNDWPDAGATAILRRCAEAAAPDGRVLVVERIVAREDDPREVSQFDLRTFLLVGGRARTLDALSELAHDAGLAVSSARLSSTGLGVIDCRPPGARG
jgi:2,7-dihydroxy-5-methyl-1-naphthoate 7-O-methyltransferase